MKELHKYLGIALIIVSLFLITFSAYVKITSDSLAVKIENQTGSCVIDGTCLHDQSNSNFMILSGVGLVVLLSGIIILLIYMKQNKASSIKTLDKISEKNTGNKKPNLSGDNKRLYDILSDSNGSMLQGELVSKSGMTKVKVSRILDKMEMQGLVERRRHGMSNIVVLKNKE